MNRIASTLLTLVAALGLVVLPAVTAAHASGCTAATLTGSYGSVSFGFNTNRPPRGIYYPTDNLGVVRFDGTGNFSTSWTNVSNGEVSRGLTGSGSYTVNSDCTGSAAFTSGDAAGFTFDFVIVSSGAEVLLTETQGGDTAIFDLKKQ